MSKSSLLESTYSLTALNRLIKEHNISTVHFDPRGHRRRERDRIFKICPNCNKQFDSTLAPNQQTCSRNCSNSIFRAGKDHPNWKGGKSTESYRRLCIKYYGHKCLICDEDKTIDVHHIDHNRKNNLPENLIPLCPTHHRYMHRKKLKPLIYDKILESIKKIK